MSLEISLWDVAGEVVCELRPTVRDMASPARHWACGVTRRGAAVYTTQTASGETPYPVLQRDGGRKCPYGHIPHAATTASRSAMLTTLSPLTSAGPPGWPH